MLCVTLSHNLSLFELFVFSHSCSCTWDRQKLPLFSAHSSLQRGSQPLWTFLIHTLVLPFSLSSSFFDKGHDVSRLQYSSWRSTVALLHSILFSGLISKPPSSNSPSLLPSLQHAEQGFSPSQPRCHSGLFLLSGYTWCCFVSLVSSGSRERCWLCWSREATTCARCSEKDVRPQSNSSCSEMLMSQPHQRASIPSPAGSHPLALSCCGLKDWASSSERGEPGGDFPWPRATGAFSQPNFKGMLGVPAAAERRRVSAQAASRFLL